MPDQNCCPACERNRMTVFYQMDDAPVHSVVLLKTREAALHYPTGEIRLAFCPDCGFITNLAYNPGLQDYFTEYESTQAYSPTFSGFSRRLAEQLIDRFDLHQKEIIEIGCGQGEFISSLCEVGDNHGFGFDPAFEMERAPWAQPDRVRFIKDFFSEQYASIQADLVICKMTLEHISDVARFVRMVHRSITNPLRTRVFFQIPDVSRVLSEQAFWDIYYEHCSYFSLGSLGHLFRSAGFNVAGLWKDYDDQYLMIDARPTGPGNSLPLPGEDDLDFLKEDVEAFPQKVNEKITAWRNIVLDQNRRGRRVVLWGSGSKGVAFLTTLRIKDEIRYTVDINPTKHGMYMAGTGQEIISPEALKQYRPDLVIVMNPVYQAEVNRTLDSLGIKTDVVRVNL